ncbi:unnamed protein product, partial [Musa hybrid cultivar]
MGELHIPVPGHLNKLLDRLNLEKPLEDGDELGYRNRGGVAQIVDSEGCRPTLLAAAAGALPCMVEGRQATFHNVINVGEITSDGGVVRAFEDRHGLPEEDITGEEEVGHVGPPPGAVDREEPETGDGEAVDMVVGMGDLLPGLLGGGVEGRRAVGAVGFREWHTRVEAIYGGRRGPDDGRLGVGGLGGLEHRDKPGDIGVHIGRRVNQRVPDAGLGGKVHDMGEGHDVEQLAKQRPIVDIALDDEDPGAVEQRLAGALEGRVVVPIKVVKAEDAIAAALEGGGHVHPDEPRGAGDEDGRAAGVSPHPGGRPHALLPRGAAPRGHLEGGAPDARRSRRGSKRIRDSGRGGGAGGEEEEGKEEGEGEEGPENELGDGIGMVPAGEEEARVVAVVGLLHLPLSRGGGSIIYIHGRKILFCVGFRGDPLPLLWRRSHSDTHQFAVGIVRSSSCVQLRLLPHSMLAISIRMSPPFALCYLALWQSADP